MAVRREIVLILLLLAVIAVLVKLAEFVSSMNVEETDASKFVIEDLRTKYPTAEIAIMAMVPKYDDHGGRYLEVQAKVTKNPDSACPERSHIFYNYPVQNFVPKPPEVITANCAVCAYGICTIAFPEEAVIASHTFRGTEAVHAYIMQNQNAVPSVTEKSDSWAVRWDSASSDAHYVVEIHRNGTIVDVRPIPAP